MTETHFEQLMRDQIARSHADHSQDPQDGQLHFTIGELCLAILAVDNDADARRFFDSYVDWLAKRWPLADNPVAAARGNIGWMFFEGMTTDRIAMWRRVTGAEHPAGTMLFP